MPCYLLIEFARYGAHLNALPGRCEGSIAKSLAARCRFLILEHAYDFRLSAKALGRVEKPEGLLATKIIRKDEDVPGPLVQQSDRILFVQQRAHFPACCIDRPLR